MSTATVFQIGQNLHAWIAAVQQGDTVAILDGGREVARLMPPMKELETTLAVATPRLHDDWTRQRMVELEAIFPEPITGASEELEHSREDRF